MNRGYEGQQAVFFCHSLYYGNSPHDKCRVDRNDGRDICGHGSQEDASPAGLNAGLLPNFVRHILEHQDAGQDTAGQKDIDDPYAQSND